ncbi:MAG: flavin reductase family protein [Gemmatimonadota bacterium]|nr:flavin reductase family protein [Gemmatimonadota bacterium]
MSSTPGYVTPASFRRTMSHHAAAVTVVTARDVEGRPVGLTANSVTSVSLTPPLVLVCLSESSASLDVIQGTGGFAINLLGSGDSELASCFAYAEAEDRFQGVPLRSGRTGVPLLEGSIAWLECRVHQTFTAGDHVVVVGGVLEVGVGDGDPLIYHCGEYRRLCT